jgi:hypothetical protein
MPEGRRQRKRNYMLFEENAINANPGPNGIGSGVLNRRNAVSLLTQPSHFGLSNPVLDIGNAVFARRSALQIRRS